MKKRHHSPVTPKPFFDESGSFQFRPVTSDARNAAPLPPLPSRLMDFFERFASNCSLECCGIHALVFNPPIEWDKRWNFNYDIFKLLQTEIDRAQALKAEVIRVRELQMAFYKDDWLFFLRHLLENMEKSKQWK